MVIIYASESGVTVVTPVGVETAEEVAEQVVPRGADYKIINRSELPIDRLFRGAWEADFACEEGKIGVNVEKAKAIAHEWRRGARAAEFAPLDEIVAKRLPDMDFATAEALRQAVRDKYAAMQLAIDAAADEVGLRGLLDPILPQKLKLAAYEAIVQEAEK